MFQKSYLGCRHISQMECLSVHAVQERGPFESSLSDEFNLEGTASLFSWDCTIYFYTSSEFWEPQINRECRFVWVWGGGNHVKWERPWALTWSSHVTRVPAQSRVGSEEQPSPTSTLRCGERGRRKKGEGMPERRQFSRAQNFKSPRMTLSIKV